MTERYDGADIISKKKHSPLLDQKGTERTNTLKLVKFVGLVNFITKLYN